jgi:HSP20 family protein
MSMRTAVTPQAPPPPRLALSGARPPAAPIPMDAWRESDCFVIAFDLPGIPLEAIEVEACGLTVTVKAERRPARRGQNARTQLAERAHGVFARRVQLADTLDPDCIKAHCENGVLTLTVPIAATARPRKITVQAGKAPQQRAQSSQAAPAAA